MALVEYNPHTMRLHVLGRRVHHGPLGIALGLLLATDPRVPLLERLTLASLFFGFGISDIHDYRLWFSHLRDQN